VPPKKPDGGYRTVFGPVFWHPSVIYERSDINAGLALTRQTAVRNSIEEDARLAINQEQTCQSSRVLSVIVSIISLRIKKSFADVNFESLKNMYMEATHKKRPARVQARDEVDMMGKLHHLWDFLKTFNVSGCVKAMEWAKWAKVPRLFVSCGEYSILAAGHVMDIIKSCYGIVEVDGCQAEFIKEPSQENIKHVFSELIYGTQNIYMAYFSDDSCVAITTKEGCRYMCNMDIKGCDSSHTQSIFTLMLQLVESVPWVHECIRWAIKQCEAPIVIKSYSLFRDLVVILEPVAPVLYSGSVLTTAINNNAELVMFSSMVDRYNAEGPPKYSDCRAFIRECAEISGYNVTIEGDECPEQLQFLKHSPSIEDGDIKPFLNLGVVLRMFGSCFGDLPGRGPWERRAWLWNRGLVMGLVHSGLDAFLHGVRDFYDVAGQHTVSKDLSTRLGKIFDERLVCGSVGASGESIARRYGLEYWEIAELFDMLCTHETGRVIETRATRVIFDMDYGYKFTAH